MATDRLYYADAYLREFDARVAQIKTDGWIALDRSAFYPTSGGQPHDTGFLLAGDREIRVTDVTVDDDGVVWHRLDGALTEGDAVHGRIDWPRRWDHMQQHAGDHMLAGALWQMLGGVTIGLHTGEKDSTIDVSLPDGRTRLTDAEIEALESTVNQRVQQDDPIRCWFPSADELASLPMRKRPTVREHVRVVAMGDYEMVPCGGTHPSSTGQIGPVKVLSCAPAKGCMRLCFVAGMRAFRYFQAAARSAETTARLLSAPIEDAPAALEKEKEAAAQARRDAEARLLQAALEMILREKTGCVYACHVPFADPGLLVKAAAILTREDGAAVALLSCPRGEARQMVFARGDQRKDDMAALLRASGARGGGKPDLAQGSAPDGEALRHAARALAQD